MRWLAAAVLAAVSCLLGSACADESNKDVSGAYELFFEDGAVRALLYLLRSAGDDYFGVLNDSTCSVARTADQLILNGCSVLSATANYVGFRLTRDDEGELAQLSAFDQEHDVQVEGRIERSKHAPVLRSAPVQLSPASTTRTRLPWDELSLDFGDGVLIDEVTLAEALDVESSGRDPVDVRWNYRSIVVPGSLRKLTMSATATINWPDLIGQTVTFSLPAGTRDSAGKTTSNYMDVDFALPRIAPPATVWELDDEAEGLVRWGGLTFVREACEGGCLRASGTLTPCAEPGLAGQLDTRMASRVVVRVRITTQTSLNDPIELGIYLGESALADVSRSSTRELLADRGAPADLGFRELELLLSAAQRRERLPFELRVLYGCRTGTGGENAQPAQATVWFDRIAAE